MNVNNRINSFVKPLIEKYAHSTVRRNGALAGQIIAAKLYRDNLLTNVNSITRETISRKTKKRLKLIKNEDVKAGFSDGLKHIINALNLSYSQKVNRLNELNALIAMDLRVEDIVDLPQLPRVLLAPQLPESFDIPQASLVPQLPESFESPRVSLGSESLESFSSSELLPASQPTQSSKSSVASRISRMKEKKVSFDDNATTVCIYPAEFDSEIGSDVAGAYENEGYTPDLDELPGSSHQFQFPKVKYTSENEELPPLPDVDYEPNNDTLPVAIPDADYVSMDEAGPYAPDGASGPGHFGLSHYNLLMAPRSEYKPHGRLIIAAEQDQFITSRSISLSVSLSEQEIYELPIAAGLRALIVEKEYNSRSSARLVSITPENKRGEKWIFTSVDGEKYKFRKVVFKTKDLASK